MIACDRRKTKSWLTDTGIIFFQNVIVEKKSLRNEKNKSLNDTCNKLNVQIADVKKFFEQRDRVLLY